MDHGDGDGDGDGEALYDDLLAMLDLEEMTHSGGQYSPSNVS